MKTTNVYAHLTSDGHLLQVVKGVDADIALETAGHLTEGVSLVLNRLHDALNEGELVFTSELKALQIMADLSSALTLSVRRNMDQERGRHATTAPIVTETAPPKGK